MMYRSVARFALAPASANVLLAEPPYLTRGSLKGEIQLMASAQFAWVRDTLGREAVAGMMYRSVARFALAPASANVLLAEPPYLTRGSLKGEIQLMASAQIAWVRDTL